LLQSCFQSKRGLFRRVADVIEIRRTPATQAANPQTWVKIAPLDDNNEGIEICRRKAFDITHQVPKNPCLNLNAMLREKFAQLRSEKRLKMKRREPTG